MPPSRSLAERFWEKVAVRDPYDCWLWTAADNGWGYGNMTWNGRPHAAHRIALIVGGVDLPVGCEVHHRCKVPRCCNPAHLEVCATPAEHRAHHTRGGCGKHGETYLARIQTGKNTGKWYCAECAREKGRQRRECPICRRPVTNYARHLKSHERGTLREAA